MNESVLYNNLLDEIRQDELALDEKRQLVRLLKKRLDKAKSANTTISVGTARLTLDSNTPVASASGTSFVSEVARVLPHFFSVGEFAVGDVANVLRGSGIGLPEKPNTKIATVLARLTSTGALERTYEGTGNVPHRYRIKTLADINAADEKETAEP